MTSYSYSGDGLRVSKKTGSVTTGFAWDTSTSVPELDQDGSSYYIYGPGGLPVERVGPTDNCYLMVDGAGSVVMSTDSTGTITSTRSFDAWGNVVAHTGDPVSLGWQGQYQDPETGFYYLRHRYYDPKTAQFTTPDPLFAVTRSRYGYAANDPVNWSDPLGLFGFGTIASAFQGIAGGIGPLIGGLGQGLTGSVSSRLVDTSKWVVNNRSTIATALSIGMCIGTGGWGCAAATVVALSFRVEQRAELGGWSRSWRGDALDAGLSFASLGIGSVVESGITGMSSAGRWQTYAARAGSSGLGIGMFAGDRVSNGDLLLRSGS
jgi:RHS repeat-associated protein